MQGVYIMLSVNPLAIAIPIVAFIVISIVGMLIVTVPIAKKQYANQFIRTSPEKWARANSCPENEEHSRMYERGLAWAESVKEFKKEVSVTSEGLKLAGEFFDFGGDKAVIILSGRAEALEYSYYFAKPYREMGYSVLVVDGRAHGLSEGKYGTAGIRERYDVGEWIEMLHRDYGVGEIVIHGVCIGSATAIYVAMERNPYLKAIVLEGPFLSFYNVLKQRTKTAGHPTFPVSEEMVWLFRRWAKADVVKYRPIKCIRRINTPMLMLCGREDISSLPEYCEKLYAACGSDIKKLVWFEHGAHSHLRIADEEKYDGSIKEFIEGL